MTTKIEHDTNLDAALATYSGRATTQSRKSKGLSMLGYTAAAGGMAFTGGDAVGAVVYNGTSRTYSVDSSPSTSNFWLRALTTYIDLDGAGGADLGIYLRAQATRTGTSTGVFSVSAQAPNGSIGDIAVTNINITNGNAANLTTAQFVGTALTFFNGRAEMLSTANGADINSRNFVVGTNNTATGYLGVRFDGDTGTVGTQYGWLKVKFEVTDPVFSSEGSLGGSLKMTILASAFDNCGDAIQVGATSGGSDCSGGGSNNVDSPATPLLALLGLGATGVTTYRRRREAGLARMVAEAKQQAEGASADA